MHNIHRILLIAKRDYLATIRTKAFIIGLVVAPILFGGGFLGVALMQTSRISRSGASPSWMAPGIAGTAVIQAAQEANKKELIR